MHNPGIIVYHRYHGDHRYHGHRRHEDNRLFSRHVRTKRKSHARLLLTSAPSGNVLAKTMYPFVPVPAGSVGRCMSAWKRKPLDFNHLGCFDARESKHTKTLDFCRVWKLAMLFAFTRLSPCVG